MPRSRANDTKPSEFGDEEKLSRYCNKTSHGALEKVKNFDGSITWVCKRDGCNYKENEEGERI